MAGNLENLRRGSLNIYQSITSNLIEWAVSEIGAEYILYGTDSPLHFAPMQRARVDKANISDQDKHLILDDNAAQLFGLTGKVEV